MRRSTSDESRTGVLQAPRGAPYLVVNDVELLTQTSVAVALPGMRSEVLRKAVVCPVSEHLDAQRARRRIHVDVLAITLVTPDVDRRRLLAASAVTQADAHGFPGDRAIEWL